VAKRLLILCCVLLLDLGGSQAGERSLNQALSLGEVLTLEISNQAHLTYRKYAAKNAKGAILYLHGISSHSGWYGQSCALLAKNGYSVYAPDRRGSGENRWDRGHLENYEDLIADLDGFIGRIHAENGNLPVYLLGVSWGGKLAMLYESMKPGSVDGVILSTPGIKPRISLSPLAKNRVLYSARKRKEKQPEIKIPIKHSSMFTGDTAWQAWIEQDPLALRRCTGRFFWESRKMDKKLKKMIKQSEAPVLLLLAEHDDIVNNNKTDKFLTKKLVGRRGDPHRLEIILYEGATHTLDFEPNWKDVVRDILDWLNRVNPRR